VRVTALAFTRTFAIRAQNVPDPSVTLVNVTEFPETVPKIGPAVATTLVASVELQFACVAQMNNAASVLPPPVGAVVRSLLVTGADGKMVTDAVVVAEPLEQNHSKSPASSVVPSARIVAGPGTAAAPAQPDT